MRAMLPAMATVTGGVNGVAVRAFRELQNPRLSQEALADRIGIDQSWYSRIESGQARRPGAHITQAIAMHLCVPVAAITYPREACDCASTTEAAA